MKKEAMLKFHNGMYELIYVEDGDAEPVSFGSLLNKLFGGWDYAPDKEKLTIYFRYGNVVIQKDYDWQFDPIDVTWMEYNVTFNEQVMKLFKQLQKDYVEFVQQIRKLEFEKEIFLVES